MLVPTALIPAGAMLSSKQSNKQLGLAWLSSARNLPFPSPLPGKLVHDPGIKNKKSLISHTAPLTNLDV